MNLFDMTKGQSKGKVETVEERCFKRHIFDRDFTIQQPNIQAIFETIHILSEVLDKDTLDYIFHVAYIIIQVIYFCIDEMMTRTYFQ